MQLALNEVSFDCSLLWRDNVSNLRLSVTISQLFRLRSMLDDSLLKLVSSDEANKLSAEIRKLHRFFALFIIAHELEQPTLHKVESHGLQIISQRNILTFTCQTSPQLNSDISHDRAVRLHQQTLKLFARNTPGHRQFTVAYNFMVVVRLGYRGFNAQIYLFGNRCEGCARQIMFIHNLV